MPMTPRSGILIKSDFDVRHIGDARQLVGFKVGVQDHTGQVVHDTFFVKRVTHADDDAAVDLAFQGDLVDDQAAVVNGDDLIALR